MFQDQVHLADILVAGKADLADTGELTSYREWAQKLFPPKLQIIEASYGELDLALLDLDPYSVRMSLFPMAHNHKQVKLEQLGRNISAEPGMPYRATNHGVGYQGCGWIFSAEDVFDKNSLWDMLSAPELEGLSKGAVVERLKGIFRVGKNWVTVDRVGDDVKISDISYRNDSRLEVIIPKAVKADWDRFENRILECLLSH